MISALSGSLSALPPDRPVAASSSSADTYRPGESEDGFFTQARCLSLVALSALALAPQPGEAAEKLPETRVAVGDYTLRVRPGDLDLSPRLKDRQLGLRLKGEMLDTELSRTRDVGDGWSSTYGLRGRIQGQTATYGDSQASLNVEAFRRWEGTVSDGIPARFEVSGGSYHDILRGTTSLGVQLRQELKGGQLKLLNQPLSWAVEGRQGYSYRVQGQALGPATSYNYSLLLGVRRDFSTTLMGKNAVVSVIVGPELHGDQSTPVEVRPKAKVRVRI